MNTQSHRPAHTTLRRQKLALSISLSMLVLGGTLPPATGQVWASEAASGQLQQEHAFDIPAQPLADALIEFAQQAGIQISVDSDLIKSTASPGVKGQVSAQQALQRLLAGSGLRWKDNAGNSLTLEPDPAAAIKSHSETLQTPDVVVLGKVENAYIGETVIDRRAIEAFAGGNGDITNLLKMHPSVQFSSTQQSSLTPGEINPADISINGARYYQNNFMIDGININNDLDPGEYTYNSIQQYDSAPSRSQGIALDADLLEKVVVYDSNVPAEYGGFNGGVIDAMTRRPSQELHGKVSTSMTRSSWTKYHIQESDQENFDYPTTGQYQPEFVKTTVRGTLEGHLSDDLGLLFNFSRKQSTIPQYQFAQGYPGENEKKDNTRQIDNFLLKSYWNVNDRLSIDGSLTYAPQENYHFIPNRINSGFDLQQGGQQGSLKAQWLGDEATWTHKLALTEVISSRKAESDDYINWYYSTDKNWGNAISNTSRSAEGSFGDIEQTQRSAIYSLKADWLPKELFGMEHRFTTGLELSTQQALWERPQEASATTGFTRDNGTSCAGISGSCSVGRLLNGASRQWSSTRTVYAAGDVEASENKYALFAQDEMVLGRLTLRPGLRLEGEDYMDQKTLAPRFTVRYDLFGDGNTLLTAGANRYYGRNLFKYRLADGRQALNSTWRRSSATGDWTVTSSQANTNKFSQLDIPYDDELQLGLEQYWLDTDWRLNYVRRFGRDQIMRSYANTVGLGQGDGVTYIRNYYVYTNAGSSESDTLTLSITPRSTFDAFGSKTNVQFAADWTHQRTANGNYDTILGTDEYNDDLVYYDGSLVRYSQLPAGDFNRPWTLRLTTITDIPRLNLTWSNFFRYRGPYEQIVTTGDTIDLGGATYDFYDTQSIKGAPTWDARLHWQQPTGKDQALFVKLDITNVLDQVNRVSYNSSGTNYSYYEVGRQYMLEVGYQF